MGGYPCPCSARSLPRIGSQLPVVELPPCAASPGHAGLNRDKNRSKEKQSTNASPAARQRCSNAPLPLLAHLTCTTLHLRCLGHPKSKSTIPPALLSKFGVKHIKTFPHMYRRDFLKTPQILPSGSLNGVFLSNIAVGFSVVVSKSSFAAAKSTTCKPTVEVTDG